MVAELNRRARPLRLGMIGGGAGSLIGRGHRYAARLDDSFELVAGAFSSSPDRALASATALGIAPGRAYTDWREMLARDAAGRSGRRRFDRHAQPPASRAGAALCGGRTSCRSRP